MDSIKVGTRVEICPARLPKAFNKYAEYDGSKGKVVNDAGSGAGESRKVGVHLEGSSRSGYREIPAAALKSIS